MSLIDNDTENNLKQTAKIKSKWISVMFIMIFLILSISFIIWKGEQSSYGV